MYYLQGVEFQSDNDAGVGVSVYAKSRQIICNNKADERS